MSFFRKESTKIILLWAFWLIILLSFQFFVTQRLELRRPDYATEWTQYETKKTSQSNKPYLIGDFMNRQLSWDSEFYLSIAMNGYDDPAVRTVYADNQNISLNYAFFPMYPMMLRIVSFPLQVLNLDMLSTATLAGIVVSSLSTLAAMFALFELSKNWLDKEKSWNALFYFLIFPSSFFFAMIYTEALFVALTFWALVFGKRKKWILAGLFAAFATMTRATGGLVLIALFVWFLQNGALKAFKEENWTFFIRPAIGGFLPIITFYLWKLSRLADGFFFVEENFFSRGLLAIRQTIHGYQYAFDYAKGHTAAMTYFSLEIIAIILLPILAFTFIKKSPALALYSLAIYSFSLFSGSYQGMIRYILAAPVLFIVPALWSKSKVFDKAWTFICILLFSLLSMLFAFDFWVA